VAVGAMVAFFQMLEVSEVTFGWLRPAPVQTRFRLWSVATVRNLFQDPANRSRIGMDCALFAVREARARGHPKVTADATRAAADDGAFADARGVPLQLRNVVHAVSARYLRHQRGPTRRSSRTVAE